MTAIVSTSREPEKEQGYSGRRNRATDMPKATTAAWRARFSSVRTPRCLVRAEARLPLGRGTIGRYDGDPRISCLGALVGLFGHEKRNGNL